MKAVSKLTIVAILLACSVFGHAVAYASRSEVATNITAIASCFFFVFLCYYINEVANEPKH